MPKCDDYHKTRVSMCKRYGSDRGVKDGTKNRTQPGRQTGPVGGFTLFAVTLSGQWPGISG